MLLFQIDERNFGKLHFYTPIEVPELYEEVSFSTKYILSYKRNKAVNRWLNYKFFFHCSEKYYVLS